MPFESTIRSEAWAAAQLARAQADCNLAKPLSIESSIAHQTLISTQITHRLAQEKLDAERHTDMLRGRLSIPSEDTIRSEAWAACQLAHAQADYDLAPSLSSRQNTAYEILQGARIMHDMAAERLRMEKHHDMLLGKFGC